MNEYKEEIKTKLKENQNLNKKVKNKIKIIKNDKLKEISFIIYGDPIPKARPRRGKSGAFYSPTKSKNKGIIEQIKKYIDLENFKLITGEIKLISRFYVTIPKNFSDTDKCLAELGFIKPTIKPDIDNYLKTYMDSFNKILWLDDGQVWASLSYKYYSKNPRTEITIKYRENIFCSVLDMYRKNKEKLSITKSSKTTKKKGNK